MINSFNYLKKNTFKILSDYWVFLFIALILYGIFESQLLSSIGVFKALIGASTIKGLGHFWFIPYIIICYWITPILYCLTYQRNKKWLIYGLVLSSFFIIVISWGYKSYFNPVWIICYTTGYYMAKILKGELSYKSLKSIGIVSLVFTIVLKGTVFILKIYPVPQMIESQGFIHNLGHLTAGWFLFSLIYYFGKRFISENNTRLKTILKFSDKYSYQIYICHALFILSPFSLLQLETPMFFNILLAVSFSIVMAIFLKKITIIISDKIKLVHRELFTHRVNIYNSDYSR